MSVFFFFICHTINRKVSSIYKNNQHARQTKDLPVYKVSHTKLLKDLISSFMRFFMVRPHIRYAYKKYKSFLTSKGRLRIPNYYNIILFLKSNRDLYNKKK